MGETWGGGGSPRPHKIHLGGCLGRVHGVRWVWGPEPQPQEPIEPPVKEAWALAGMQPPCLQEGASTYSKDGVWVGGWVVGVVI